MLIGLGQYARVGKDEVGKVLVRDHGFVRVAFADALKDMALILDPLIFSNAVTNVGVGRGRLAHVVRSSGWEEAKLRFPEVRRILQNLGVAARETFGENVWICTALDAYVDSENVVVTDVRFSNEFEMIRGLGGKLVKISRPGYGPMNDHISENGIPEDAEWDYVLPNHRTLDDLPAEVAAMLVGLFAPEPEWPRSDEPDVIEPAPTKRAKRATAAR